MKRPISLTFTHPYYDPLWADLERLGMVAAVHPTPGLWNPEWTSHGPFFEKIRGRLHQAPLIGGEDEARYQQQLAHWLHEETGYQAIQGTKPQTLTYGLSDSPVGLAAWIVEKFRTWSDCSGEVERRFPKDELLTNITIYWATGAIGSSFWPYYDRIHQGWPLPDGARIEVPTGYTAFPHEILIPPRAWAERVFNIQRWTVMPAGGHFAALEEPEALAADIRAFFREFRLA